MNEKPSTLRIRPEENAVLLWDGDDASAYVSGDELAVLRRWAVDGTDTAFTLRLKRLGLLSDNMRDEVIKVISRSAKVKAPLRSFTVPESLHVELISHSKNKQIMLPYTRYSEVLADAESMGVFQIVLDGGEPLSCPYLTEAVAEAKGRGFAVHMLTGGAGLDQALMDRLTLAGLDRVQVRLNGSTEAVCGDGYDDAMNALKLASKSRISRGISWVARKDNLDDFNALVTLASSFDADNINILRYQACSEEVYTEHALSGSRLIKLAELVKSTKRIKIKIDSAFSNLLCYLNGGADNFGGCGAGRRFIALDSAGRFHPCRHMQFASDMQSLRDYWLSSPDLAAFRQLEDNIGKDCKSCRYLKGCRGCRAIAAYLGRFEDGEKDCIFSKLF